MTPTTTSDRPTARRLRIAVIGAGMSGLLMGIRLLEAGHDDVTVLEKADDLGGTWRDNTYPGVGCDVAARSYVYASDPDPAGTSLLPAGAEVLDYFRRVATRRGITDRIAYGREVVRAVWDEEAADWTLTFADGASERYDVVISATGVLHHPRVPDLPGLDTFAGAAFHTARWDHDVPLEGRRIGILGTGASGVQVTGALAGVARPLTVFQRTPQWIYPLPNPRSSRLTRAAYRRWPVLARASYRAWRRTYDATFANATAHPGLARWFMQTACRVHLRLAVRDPELRRALTPDDEPMCRRLIMTTRFYPALQRDDVRLVTAGIERIEPAGVRTVDGELHELDVLVLATGFDFHAYLRPIEVVGRDGVTLEELWDPAPRAYRSVALPQMPNLFLLMGPHSPVGNQSLIGIAETQSAYLLQLLEALRDGRARSIAPRRDVTDRLAAELAAASEDTVYRTGCSSFYLGADGVPTVWPGTPKEHEAQLRAPRWEELELEPVRAPAAA